MTRHRALSAEDLWVGEMRSVLLAGRRVLLLRTDAGVFAYEDRCPHLGFQLSRGSLDGFRLTCAAHRFEYDARTGQGLNPKNVQLKAFPATVVGDAILVDLEGDPA